MRRLAVWDPGQTTGFIQAEFDDTTLPRIIDKVELPGGLEGVCELIVNGWDSWKIEEETWVSERFRMTPRVRTQAQVEPLRIEGVVQFAHPGVVWQYPDQMLLAGAGHGSPSRNKTAADNVLRGLGLWTLPSEVDYHADANDINSAMKHLVAYLRNVGHEPTLEALRGLL